MAQLPRLDTLDPFLGVGPGCMTMVVETTKGSRNKLAFDPVFGAMRLRHVLPEGMAFPFDFGFVPGTAAGDGDPLDVLLFCDEGLPSGSVLEARVIGLIEARQWTADTAPVENHRVLAVPEAARAAAAIHAIGDLRPGLVEEVEAFLSGYNRLRGIHFEPLGRRDATAALALIRSSRRGSGVQEASGRAST